ncbi:MAG: peptidoglycan-binding protein [Candidatus Omnitrophica bacterium]|nr:peptidoglycan-binding protein [Candidatus Omnitrophota bacterium]
MPRNGIVLIVIFILLFSVTGCATSRKHEELEAQGLRNQISVLEAQIQAKDEEIDSLREALAKATTEEKTDLTKDTGKKRVSGEEQFPPAVKQVQVALQNAGYNPGSVDGRSGKQTKEAIKAFQRANNLKADGKVGNKTWELLKVYLVKKVK